MNEKKKTRRQSAQVAVALVVTAGLVVSLSVPLGAVPPLATTFNPGTGIWTSAASEQVQLESTDFDVKGVQAEVQVAFDAHGTPHIRAQQNEDAFVALGMLHGRNRLFQMDLMRRKGRGLLSEVVGARALEADRFQRQLGLARTAHVEWEEARNTPELQQVLEAYARGVNEAITELQANDQLPLMFKMLGYEPTPWTPEDSLVIKGLLTQMMSLKSTPLIYELLRNALGEAQTTEVLPILPPTEALPYAKGTVEKSPLKPYPISGEAVHQARTKGASASLTPPTPVPNATPPSPPAPSDQASASVAPLIARLAELPSDRIDQHMNSNAWVVGGARTASGKPMLASDPHLDLTMPSTWYQARVEAPQYRFSGATVPGLPFALVGSNDQIAWGMTNGENQQTFYYRERTDDAHPDQYYWQGAWHPWTTRTESIPVKGQDPEQLTIRSSIHGPLVETEGMSLTLNWTGSIPNGGAETLRQLMQASNYDQFLQAFSAWGSPAMNFAYADRSGNIGMLAAGPYPVFPEASKPWFVLSGTGEDDIIGAVPFEDVPKTYNPPEQVIVSANQRQVGREYPYFIGTTNDFEPGYRARAIHASLAAQPKLTADDFARAQYDVTDTLALAMVPVLVSTLQQESLSELEKQALAAWSTWDYQMTEQSVAASVWWTFLDAYKHAAFDKLWAQGKLSVDEHKVLDMRKLHSLAQVLEQWTLTDPTKMAPLIRSAFQTAVETLRTSHGEQLANWTWERLHTLEFPHIAQVAALGYPARGAKGDTYTPNMAADLDAHHGPSWRMIVDWGTEQQLGIYPGGQSENPVSPLYQDRVDTWWAGSYLPMQSFEDTKQQEGRALWTLRPAR